MLDLFKELQQYVEDQGFVLDEIEQKTERTETTIKVAVSAIKDARDIKDMVRRNKKILWMILAAVLLTFLIIVIASITSQQPVEDSIVLVIDNKPVTVVQTCDPMKDYDCVGWVIFVQLFCLLSVIILLLWKACINQNVFLLSPHKFLPVYYWLNWFGTKTICLLSSSYKMLSFKCAFYEMYYSNMKQSFLYKCRYKFEFVLYVHLIFLYIYHISLSIHL